MPASYTVEHNQSWRHTITDTLALTQSAVKLDTKNTDPLGVLAVYIESTRRIHHIMVCLEHYGVHTLARQLAAIVHLPFFHGTIFLISVLNLTNAEQ
jgi:hypothetical protein